MKQLTRKIVFTGGPGVGKSSLIHCLLHGTFQDPLPEQNGVVIERGDFHSADKHYVTTLWDLPGEFQQNQTPPSYFMGSSVVCWLLDPSQGFDRMQMEEDQAWMDKLIPEVPRVYILSKSDLIGDQGLPNWFLQKGPLMLSSKADPKASGQKLEEIIVALLQDESQRRESA